jgi:hypothetical protein
MKSKSEELIEQFKLDEEESFLEYNRKMIASQYKDIDEAGYSFGEILGLELFENKLGFNMLAEKWGIGVETAGELIYDHCKRLSGLPKVDHKYKKHLA